MEESQEVVIKKEKKDWTEDTLLEKWQQFAQKLKDKQKTNLYNIFERHSPIKNNNELIIELVSLSEKSEIEEIKLDLLDFLKKELKNDFIKLNITLSKNDEKTHHILDIVFGLFVIDLGRRLGGLWRPTWNPK